MFLKCLEQVERLIKNWPKISGLSSSLFFRVGFDWYIAMLSLLSAPPQQVHDNLGQPFFPEYLEVICHRFIRLASGIQSWKHNNGKNCLCSLFFFQHLIPHLMEQLYTSFHVLPISPVHPSSNQEPAHLPNLLLLNTFLLLTIQ